MRGICIKIFETYHVIVHTATTQSTVVLDGSTVFYTHN